MNNKTPKIFVGTMSCGEGDLEECIKSLCFQARVDVTHEMITNLPEREAHNKLWNTWREVKQDFDMFVKLDADTVLSHENVLSNLWSIMNQNVRITGIQAPLLDYFTDGFINGLNCFSPRVTFLDSRDDLFCDRNVDVDHDIVIRSDMVPNELRPAGKHCFFSTEMQAFHFGLHRALKNQVNTLVSVSQAYHKHGDRLRKFALLGAHVSAQFCDGGFNYADEKFQIAFEIAKKHVNK